jgi:hypothetical protein
MSANPTSLRAGFSLKRYFVVVAIAAAANVILYFIGSAIGAAMSVTMSGGQDIGWPEAIIATAVPLALAGTIVWLLTRRWPRLLPFARVAGLVLAAASAAIPFFVAVDTASAVTLAAMHLVAGLAWFLGTARRA